MFTKQGVPSPLRKITQNTNKTPNRHPGRYLVQVFVKKYGTVIRCLVLGWMADFQDNVDHDCWGQTDIKDGLGLFYTAQSEGEKCWVFFPYIGFSLIAKFLTVLFSRSDC